MAEKCPTQSKINGSATGRKGKIKCFEPELIQKGINICVTEIKDATSNSVDSGSLLEMPSTSGSSIACKPQNPSCLFCFEPTTSNVKDVDPNEVLKMYRNLCNQMKQNQKQIPAQLTPKMFPFCSSCEELAKKLWYYQKVLEDAERNIFGTISAIQEVVAGAVLVNLDIHSAFSTLPVGDVHQIPFTKLRDIIFKDFQNNLREQQLDLAKNTVSRNQQVLTTNADDVIGKTEAGPSNATVGTEQLNLNSAGTAKKNVSLTSKKLKEKVKQKPLGVPLHQETQHPSAPGNKTNDSETRKREGVLIYKKNTFEVYWTSSASTTTRKKWYLECSKCSFSKYFDFPSQYDMQWYYEILEMHGFVDHSDEKDLVFNAMRNLERSSPIYPCRLCKVIFTEAPARDRHEFLHH